MTVRYVPLTVITIVTGAGEAVLAELSTQNQPPLSRYCALVPGEIAWDNCDCGQLAQSVGDVYPSNNFPTSAADQRRTPCGPNLIIIPVTLSLTRCVPVSTNDGRPPSCDKLLAAAITLEVDRWVVRQAITCYLRDLRDTYVIADFSVGVARTVGPQGACVGVELSYLVGVGSSCCSG